MVLAIQVILHGKSEKKGLSLKFLHGIPMFFGTLFDHFQCMLSLRCEEEEDILHIICVRILQRWQTCFSNTDN